MLNEVLSVFSPAVAVDRVELPKLRVKRTITLAKDQYHNLGLKDGYGATAGTLVLTIGGIELLPGEVTAIAIPLYATGLSVFALLGTPTKDAEAVGAQVLILG